MINTLSKKEIFERKDSEIVLDIEIYPNYLLLCFDYFEGGKVYFESSPDEEIEFNLKQLLWIMKNNVIYTFNGNSFDIVLINLILLRPDLSIKNLHDIATALIYGERSYSIYKEYAIDRNLPVYNHVDLIELAIGQSSLKTYAGRINAPNMQDLPYEPYTHLNDEQKQNVLTYCWSDTENTKILKKSLQEQITLREKMSLNYGVDLRSKSDAQIAESVITSELRRKHNIYAKKTNLDTSYSFKYNIPSCVSFENKDLNDLLDVIRNTEFRIDDKGSVIMPKSISGFKIKLNKSIYSIGIGGLHSNENWIAHDYSDPNSEHMLIDRDVASYYPNIILTQKLYPKHLSSAFLDVYANIVATRLKAKKEGDTVTANALKITVNGSFGKFGNKYSVLYSPDLMIQVTLSGQLYLLMLIEWVEKAGFEVISANTDGFVTKIKKDKKNEFDAIITEWERVTSLATEETIYNGYYGRDVNNYIAVKPGGKTKTKGAFGESGLSKNPAGQVIFESIASQLSGGCDIDTYIRTCNDITKFLFVRKVEGGCVNHKRENIGKVIRWYVAKGEFYPLYYKKNGNKVPDSYGAKPMMRLSDTIPEDLNREYYIRSAKNILKEWFGKKEQLELF